jgi:hypothetical protein
MFSSGIQKRSSLQSDFAWITRELNRLVARLKGADRMGNLKISFPHYARRAVAVYYRMTRRVLDLYEMGNFSMLSDLQKALQVQSSCHGD